jgi:hypothetical protein
MAAIYKERNRSNLNEISVQFARFYATIEFKLVICRRVDTLLLFTDLVLFRDFFGENTVREWNVVVGHEYMTTFV